MTKQEVRAKVNEELLKRGYAKPSAISNKQACKLLGLMPENVIGIGTTNGRKLLTAWVMGQPVSYEKFGGVLREANTQARVKRFVATPVRSKRDRVRKAFYESREWREVRYEALRLCGAKCCCCGRGRTDGVVLHVDHIQPRSKFPHLELEVSNLQVLCEDCNLGKSNKDSTDWRSAHA